MIALVRRCAQTFQRHFDLFRIVKTIDFENYEENDDVRLTNSKVNMQT
jgi:hypothetical protein